MKIFLIKDLEPKFTSEMLGKPDNVIFTLPEPKLSSFGVSFLLLWGDGIISWGLTHDAEKAMAPHSSALAWKIPWTEEPGGLQSMGPLRVGHDWATSLSLFTFMHWRRKWQPTPVLFAWRIPGMGKPGGLPSMVLHRVGQDWGDLAAAAATHVCLIAQVQVFAIDWLWAGLGCTCLLTILVWGHVHCTSQWPVRNQVA